MSNEIVAGKPAHTKGPWVVGWGNGLTGPTTATPAGPTCAAQDGKYQVVSVGQETIAIVPQQEDGVMDANARLISLAPDLLAALSGLLPMFAEWHSEFPEHVGDLELPALELARAAVSKALGEQA